MAGVWTMSVGYPRLVAATLLLAVLVTAAMPAARAEAQRDPCANYLCTEYRQNTPSCMRFEHSAGGLSAHQRGVRCYVVRAARHFRVSVSRALAVSHRESKWHEVPRPANRFGYKGPFQFSRVLFAFTPYGRRLGDKRESAKWSSLGFALLESRGQGCNWNGPSYCG